MDKQPIIAITGAGGFIGAKLAEHFISKGWKVRGLVHNLPKETTPGVEYHIYSLAAGPDEKLLDDVDCLIHCAFAKGEYELNVGGTKKLVDACWTFGVKKKVFISSISSMDNALSIYGKQKWACEKYFSSDLIIRPGLVLGYGGLFGQMREYLKRKQTIPLISGGKQPMQTVFIEDLTKTIYSAIEQNLSGVFTIASTEKTTYKEFYTLLCESLKTKPKFVSIPYWVFFSILSVSETLGIKLPVSRENLLGLKQLKYIDTTNDLQKVGLSLQTAAESLNQLAKNG